MNAIIHFTEPVSLSMLTEIEKLFTNPNETPPGFRAVGKPKFGDTDNKLGFPDLEIVLPLDTSKDLERAMELLRIVANKT